MQTTPVLQALGIVHFRQLSLRRYAIIRVVHQTALPQLGDDSDAADGRANARPAWHRFSAVLLARQLSASVEHSGVGPAIEGE
jgi:hypothetical protein